MFSCMTNPEHLSKLKEGVEAWNRWRRAHVVGGVTEPDLSETDLDYANLEGAFLSGVNLSHSLLSRANLKRANLILATVSHTDLSSAM